MGIPRIRGKVGQAEPGQGFDGKWFFTIEVATLFGERVGDPLGLFGPFDSEKIAQDELKKAVRLCVEEVETTGGGKPSGQYLDMKNGGILRSWDEQ